DLDVCLFPALSGAETETIVRAVCCLCPLKATGVQAVTDSEIVDLRHHAKNFSDITRRVYPCTIRIPGCPRLDEPGDIRTIGICRRKSGWQRAEHAHVVKRSGERRVVRIDRGPHRIAELIDSSDRWRSGFCRNLENIAALPVVEVPEDAISSARREHGCIAIAACSRKQTVPEKEEECFVLDNRSANTSRVFIQIGPGRNDRCGLRP